MVLALSNDISVSLIECKDRLSVAARHALGDGLLRLRGEIGDRVVADLTFNYLGDVEEILGRHSIFADVDLAPKGSRSPGEYLRSRIEIDAFRRGALIEFHLKIDPSDNGIVAGLYSAMEASIARAVDRSRQHDGLLTTATDVGADELSAKAWLELAGAYGRGDESHAG